MCLFEIRQDRPAEIGVIRNAPQQRHAPALHHGFAHVVLGLLMLVGNYLVDDHTGNPYVVVLAKDPIQLQLIEGRAEPSVGDQHLE